MKKQVYFEDKTRIIMSTITENIFTLLDTEIETTPENTPQPMTATQLTAKKLMGFVKPKIVARYNVYGTQETSDKKNFPMEKVPEKGSQDLLRTKPCHWVSRESPNDAFSVCTRKNCTYAHSLAELRLHPCKFGTKCFRKDADCHFVHPSETPEEFFKRNPLNRPDLPAVTAPETLEAQQGEITSAPTKLSIDVPEDPKPRSNALVLNVSKEKLLATVQMAVDAGLTRFEINITG